MNKKLVFGGIATGLASLWIPILIAVAAICGAGIGFGLFITSGTGIAGGVILVVEGLRKQPNRRL